MPADSPRREQLACIPLERIAYVQFDDAPAPAGGSAMTETMHRRVMPGDGTFELERFATTLLDRGWSGTVSVEGPERRPAPAPGARVRGARLPDRRPVLAISPGRAVRALRAWAARQPGGAGVRRLLALDRPRPRPGRGPYGGPQRRPRHRVPRPGRRSAPCPHPPSSAGN